MMTEATPEEWEEFNRVERESRAKQESIRGIKRPTREQLMAEVTILTELVRVLSDRVKEMEKPWVGLPTIVILDVYAEVLKEWRGGHQKNGQIAFARAIEQALKERNT